MLTEIAKTPDNLVYEGTLTECKDFVFSHGCDLASESSPKRGLKIAWLHDQSGNEVGLMGTTRNRRTILILPIRFWDVDVAKKQHGQERLLTSRLESL